MTKPTSRTSLSDPYVRTSLIPRIGIDGDTFGRWSEGFARYMGTSTFILQMSVFVGAWFVWNTVAPASLRFDEYPFQFMTLALSLQASYAAPLILLAQNRQDDRDRISMEEDRSRAAQTKADTEYLARELAALRMKVGDVTTRDYLRSELERVRGDVAELTAALQAANVIATSAPSSDRRSKSQRDGRGGKTKKEAVPAAAPAAAPTGKSGKNRGPERPPGAQGDRDTAADQPSGG